MYIDVPAAQFDSLMSFLTKLIFWSQVTVEEADLAVVTVLGGELTAPADAVLSREVACLGGGYGGAVGGDI